ncbi:hypothetical protein EG68_02325 [Paragonimus skrjabini miyazakii]|uniref:Uncharacterized protein n=1 Tax=Paragonimus skrjabini miyazakii TaxID=59628 RepID=A0A8S9Z1G3_9TREM|nr:hypothetical protein EG68_02325 [Paragonimus skrjabini miyazakii]
MFFFPSVSFQWTDVTCFILTDQLLITKSYKRENADRYKVYKTPVRLDKLVINKMSENCFVCAVLDDFHMITHLYTFVTSLMHTDEWCSHLRKAKASCLLSELGTNTNHSNHISSYHTFSVQS